jgi:large subunit ribosomal protein L35
LCWQPSTPRVTAVFRLYSNDIGYIFVFHNLLLTFALHFNSPNGSISVPPVRIRQQGVILKGLEMPKVKTNSSAKKRFKITGTGKISFQKAFKRHILTKKSKKRKRLMNKKGTVSAANTDFVKRLLRLK